MRSTDPPLNSIRSTSWLMGVLIGAGLTAIALALPRQAVAEEPVQAAIQAVQVERRAAILALQKGERERAQAIVRRLEMRWSVEIAGVPLVRRSAEPGLDDAIRRFDSTIGAAAALIELGDTEGAIEELLRLSSTFDLWRRARRVPILADCVDQFTRSWERLELARDRIDAEGAIALADQAVWARAVLASCTALARATLQDAEFLALTTRLDRSLERLEEALRRGDANTAARLIGEQRGLERAIAYRS